MFPGPVTKSAFAQRSFIPYPKSAIACAPPTAYTSVTPRSAQVARMVGCGNPPNSFCGGEAIAILETFAICAGITFIMTLLG